MMAMRYLPAGLLVDQKKVLVVGAGQVALQKIRALRRCKPRIEVVAPQACPQIRRLAARGVLILSERVYRRSDVRGAALVVVATGLEKVNRQVLKDAHRAGAMVNVVDVPLLCDFIFVSVLRIKGFVVSISTDGKNAAMSRQMRIFLEDKIREFPGRVRPRKAGRDRREK